MWTFYIGFTQWLLSYYHLYQYYQSRQQIIKYSEIKPYSQISQHPQLQRLLILFSFQNPCQILSPGISFLVEYLTCHRFVYNRMKHNQKVLELHPHLSKLIDSLCFQLAVNVPDENSLSLLEILQMRRNGEITNEQFKQLYKSWLESKNVFDLFSAKQVRIYPKNELVSNSAIAEHLHINSINSSLELLHDLYDDLFEGKKRGEAGVRKIKETEDLFSYLDCDGNIHLRLSNLFFLHLAMQLLENAPISQNYQTFKPIFKQKNKELCEVEGMVSLRWFKNYFLFKVPQADMPKQVLGILKDIEKNIRINEGKGKKSTEASLPSILDEAFVRWRTTSRFSGLFQSKKKKLEIYHRIFDQNQQIFFFNGGKEDIPLSESYFAKKYGEQYIKSLEIDNRLLKEFDQIVKEVLNQYLGIVSRMQASSSRHNKSNFSQSSAVYQTPSQHAHTSIQYPSHQSNASALYTNTNRKYMNQSFQTNNKYSNHKSDVKSKDKTPTKLNKGNETKRFNVTPTNKNKVSPFIQRQFGSTQKSLSKNKNSLTPTKSTTGNYTGSLYMGNTTQQVYRNSKKQGLQKDSFYQKLFFFRNKRVESFDIVLKRLKGK